MPFTDTPSPVSRDTIRPQIPLVLSAVFLVYLGQMTLNPVIAPLAREVGLAEWQIGVTISTAAVMVVATSQFWGRRSQSWGRKPVLITAMTLAAGAMTVFALVAQLGMVSALGSGVLFALFILCRGILFGGAIAAVPPTAQAYIANVTPDETTRVKGMAGVGAVQGIAMIGGAVIGGGLAIFGLIVPMIVVPVLLLAGLLLILAKLRPEPTTELVTTPPRISPRDPRVWPYLIAGFGMFTALGFIQVAVGFFVQDRFHLSAETTGALPGASLLAAGIGMILAQAVIVPRSGWRPARLLRVGCAVATVGYVVLIPQAGLALFIASMFLIGLGLGVAMPGYTAGPSLLMDRTEQGGLAGLISATTGLTFVIAPTAGTALYGFDPLLPILTGGAITLFVTIFLVLHPRFRSKGQ